MRDQLAVLPIVTYDDQTDEQPDYDNEWVVNLVDGPEAARETAEAVGFQFVGQVRGFPDMYIFRKKDVRRQKREAVEHTKRLVDYEQVLWAEQQRFRRRTKRAVTTRRPLSTDTNSMFNDPLWSKQWQLHDTRTARDLPKLDMHVVGAWKRGYTGKGVVVSILDDGVQHNHTDLAANYDPKASYDLNDDDDDPMPTFNDFNKHGTRCAGEVAMVANNGKCGVGVAYNAKIGGVRMLDGKITDRIEAEALKFNIDHIDIFSASWGPNDDGKTVEGPGTLAERAILDGITYGRNGKGTIYVWASGNGGTYQDDCDCDGYTDSVYTFSVSSASEHGTFPWYGEKCASTLTATYSSGAYMDQKIATTDIMDKCTEEHTGTSASAPLAAGIIALGLEANPSLTWRDVQHIAVWTAEPAPLIDRNDGWQLNGAGLLSNTRFGFGLMNAEAFVDAASTWTSVPKQHICRTEFPNFIAQPLAKHQPGVVKFKTDACKGQANEIDYLEHVQLVADIEHTRRGNLAIFLVSPMGTKTKLLSTRRRDDSKAGFRHWPFMSVHTWGESPGGWWHLEVFDKDGEVGTDSGSIKNLTLILYGTKEQPKHYETKRKYNMKYNQVSDNGMKRATSKQSEEEDEAHLNIDGAKQSAVDVSNELLDSLSDPSESSDPIGDLERIDRALDILGALDDRERARRYEQPTFVADHFVSR
uniref:P/Homo B domain-containing protein n=1 Tax=Plectus sambesii TaxID=2011161 RepID=A0A914V516_9BILA